MCRHYAEPLKSSTVALIKSRQYKAQRKWRNTLTPGSEEEQAATGGVNSFYKQSFQKHLMSQEAVSG